MERIIRIAAGFVISALVGLVSIVIANGELTWSTISLTVLVVLTAALVAAVWTIVHGHFDQAVEIGLTVLIVAIIAGVIGTLLVAGDAVKAALGNVFSTGSAWWLIAPVLGTVALSFLFGLHAQPKRRATR